MSVMCRVQIDGARGREKNLTILKAWLHFIG